MQGGGYKNKRRSLPSNLDKLIFPVTVIHSLARLGFRDYCEIPLKDQENNLNVSGTHNRTQAEYKDLAMFKVITDDGDVTCLA
jgi:hypothetical protein